LDRFSFGSSNSVMLVDQNGIVRHIAKKFSENLETKIENLFVNADLANDDFKFNCTDRKKFDDKINKIQQEMKIIKDVKSVKIQFNFKRRFEIIFFKIL
jgi:hypothetical protein